MKKYRLVDFYDGDEKIIGEYDTKKDLQKAYDDRVQETDGECLLKIGVLSLQEQQEIQKKEHGRNRKR